MVSSVGIGSFRRHVDHNKISWNNSLSASNCTKLKDTPCSSVCPCEARGKINILGDNAVGGQPILTFPGCFASSILLQRTMNSTIHLDVPPHPLINWQNGRVCTFFDPCHSSYNLLPLSNFAHKKIEHSPAVNGTWGRTMLLHGVRPNEGQKHFRHQQ